MSEEVPRKWAATRKWSFKFFGALFMRDKGTNGEENQAISAHKTLGLVLLVSCFCIWMFGGIHLTEDQELQLLEAGYDLPSKWGEPPDLLVYSWMALLGVVDIAKGTMDVFRKR